MDAFYFNDNINMIVYRHLKPCGETFYIGIAKVKRRPFSKANRNKWWWNIVNKYGYEVQILKSDLTWEEAKELEIDLIAYYGRKDLGLGPLVNLTDGGQGVLGLIGNIGNTGKTHSKKTKEQISKTKKGTPAWNKGLIGFCKGKLVSKETREKMSKSKIGNVIPLEQRIRQSKKIKGGNNVNAKLVINLETGIFYDCVDDAATAHNLNHRTLITYLSGHRKNKTNLSYCDN